MSSVSPRSLSMQRPLVSVVIPSFNHAPFVEAAVRSVEAQTYRPIELVVVDDGSTDGSATLLRELFADSQLDRALLFEQSHRGAHAAIMRGVEASSGDVVGILNSDDSYHPLRIERLMPYLGTGRHALAFSGVKFIDDKGDALLQSSAWRQWYQGCIEQSTRWPTIGFALLVHNFSVSSGNFFFRRSLYDKLAGFNNQRFAHDWDFLIRSLHYSEPAFDRAPLLNYRIHESNTTETVREFLRAEGGQALERYIALTTNEPTPNTLAPCPANWPGYFHRFATTVSPSFAPDETLAALWETDRRHPFAEISK